MFAVIAAVLFGFALLLQLTGNSFGTVITATTLTTAGLLFLALHAAGAASHLPRYSRRRR